MPHVSTHYRVYLGAAHHRRPRNPQPWVEPYPSGEVDVASGGIVTPFAPPTLPYTPSGGATVEPAFVFWSLSDGSAGRTQTSLGLTETVGANPLTLIAWYYLPPGDGPGTGGPVLLIDAYSVLHGDFVDDDFVTVTSNPSLTVAANIDGSVPTDVAETIEAYGHIPTTEAFDKWVATSGPTVALTPTAVGTVLTAPASSGGLAVALYKPTGLLPPPQQPRQGLLILYGIINDASGIAIPLGGGPPIPIGPWGPLVARLLAAMSMHASASGLSKARATAVEEVTSAEVAEVAIEIANVAQKGARGD